MNMVFRSQMTRMQVHFCSKNEQKSGSFWVAIFYPKMNHFGSRFIFSGSFVNQHKTLIFINIFYWFIFGSFDRGEKVAMVHAVHTPI